MTTRVIISVVVNAPPREAWAIVDDWVGLTAPDSIDSVNVEVDEEVE